MCIRTCLCISIHTWKEATQDFHNTHHHKACTEIPLMSAIETRRQKKYHDFQHASADGKQRTSG